MTFHSSPATALLYFPGVTPKLYKAADVCEAAGLQPYVLRSWEKEFPGIGVQKSPDAPKLYRESDLEQVLRIKQLVFAEGLTLGGARRRLEEAAPRPANVREAEIAEVLDTLSADARSRIALVRNGLKSILDVLSKAPGAANVAEFREGESVSSPKRGSTPRGRSSASTQTAAGRAAKDGGWSGRRKASKGVSAGQRRASAEKTTRRRSGKRKRSGM